MVELFLLVTIALGLLMAGPALADSIRKMFKDDNNETTD